MRKILIALLMLTLVAAAAGALWIFKGRELAMWIDNYGITSATSEPIRGVRYEGNGTGGVLHVNELSLTLSNAVAPLQPPSIGSTKDGKLGLATGGKVFPLGQLPKSADDSSDVLSTSPENGDDARITLGHSVLSWPAPFDLNFMTGASASRRRHAYQRLTWVKPNGMKLEMLWRYEQYFDQANGWTSPTMTREGSTGLIKIEIKE